jgi:alkanesulfonate monooxygenase SsuD/methylene tetrahydromethanopterin reductase-like flavin-dependent oxidoreductase (luciferase family)
VEVDVKVGIGLPLAVPGRDAAATVRWAAESERLGFHSLGSIDRLVFDNLEPLVALAAAAAVTERVGLVTAVLNVGWRNNATLLAKQLATLDQISGGRLTAGMALGAWPDDYEVSGAPFAGRGKGFEQALSAMRRVWDGGVTSVSGPMPKLSEGRPEVLLGGFVPVSYERVARLADGWVAPSFSQDIMVAGIAAVREEWAKAGRSGAPRFLTERYFSLGSDAAAQRDHYVSAYYGDSAGEYFDTIRADSIIDDSQLRSQLTVLAEAGIDEVVLLPCSDSLDQIGLLADALSRVGARCEPTWEL